MKRIINASCLIVGFIFALNSSALAQSGDIKLGGGLIYGTEIETLGIGVDGYYRINEDFRAGASLGYFFPNDNSFIDINWFEIDFNGNYIFHEEDELMAYGLAGLNFLIATAEFNGNSESSTEVGLNIGAGLEYMVNFGALFGELKFAGIGGDADQLVLDVGVRFPIQ